MKIIAVTQRTRATYADDADRKFLIEATRDELIKLAGYYQHPTNARWAPAIGDDINVDKMYGRLWSLERDKEKLNASADQLRNLASLIESFDPIVRGAGNDDAVPEATLQDELRRSQ